MYAAQVIPRFCILIKNDITLAIFRLLLLASTFHLCHINFLTDKNTTPETAMVTDRNIVAVAEAMSLAVVFSLEWCLRPGCGSDGLICDLELLMHRWSYSYFQDRREPSFLRKSSWSLSCTSCTLRPKSASLKNSTIGSRPLCWQRIQLNF